MKKFVLALIVLSASLHLSIGQGNMPGIRPIGGTASTNLVRDPYSVWVSSRYGNDTFLGTEQNPKRTIRCALNAATTGGTVIVLPGEYNENKLLKRGVDLFGFPRANNIYTQTTTNDDGAGPLDERFAGGGGAFTNSIEWPGKMVFIALTNLQAFYNLDTDDGSFSYNLNTLGCLVITNPLTQLNGHIGELGAGGLIPTIWAALYMYSGNADLGIRKIYDPIEGINFTNAGTSFSWSSQCSGIQTLAANLDLDCPDIGGSFYSWHWSEPAGEHTNNVHIVTKVVRRYMYGTAHSPQYKGWISGFEANTKSVAAPVTVYGGGNWYFGFQKYNSPFGGPVFESFPSDSVSNSVTWLDGMKGSSNAKWVNMQGSGTLKITLTDYEDVGGGTLTDGFTITPGSTLIVEGGSTSTNASGRTILFHGGNALFKDFNGYSTNAVGNAGVFVRSAGLQMQNCVIVTGTTNCLNSTNAQTVNVYGTLVSNKTNSLNVTIGAGGSFIQNSAVR